MIGHNCSTESQLSILGTDFNSMKVKKNLLVFHKLCMASLLAKYLKDTWFK